MNHSENQLMTPSENQLMTPSDSEITVNVYSVASEIERAIFEEMRGTNMKYKNRYPTKQQPGPKSL